MTRNVILLAAQLLSLILVSGCTTTPPPTASHDSDLVGGWFKILEGTSPSTDGTILIFNADGTGTVTDNSYSPGESDPLNWSTNGASTSLTLTYPADDNYTITYAYEITGTRLVLSWTEEGNDLTESYEKQTSI